jgi:hypothetical protein
MGSAAKTKKGSYSMKLQNRNLKFTPGRLIALSGTLPGA